MKIDALFSKSMDSTSDIGWRCWSREDSQRVCQWFMAKANEGGIRPDGLICYNIKQAARRMGVSAAKFTTWLKRRDHPVPHIQDGRKILISETLLAKWIEEESERNRKGRS